MSNDARFDPRFDPAFQPGYEGPLATPRANPVTTPPLITQPPRYVESEGAVASAPIEVVESDDDSVDRGTNPFVIALGVVALALVGGGLFLVSRLRDLFVDTQGTGDFDYVTMNALMSLAPFIIALGLATGIGVLFLFAVRWNRR